MSNSHNRCAQCRTRRIAHARSPHPARPVQRVLSLSAVTTRGIQIALGVVWLLDGLFQFKSFMYTHGIVTEVFAPAAKGQPGFIGGPMTYVRQLLRA